MNTEPKTEQQKKFENEILSQGIMLSLDMENNFKIYSYRIIDTQTFTRRIAELVREYEQKVIKLSKEHNPQLKKAK